MDSPCDEYHLTIFTPGTSRDTPPPQQLSTQDKLITQKNLKIPQILFSPPTHKSYLKRWLHDTIEDFPKEIKNVKVEIVQSVNAYYWSTANNSTKEILQFNTIHFIRKLQYIEVP